MATFKKLMFRTGVSLTANDCANITAQDDTALIALSESGLNEHILFEELVSDESFQAAALRLTPFIENIVTYSAGWVVRSITKKLKFPKCIEVLYRDADTGNTSILLTLKNNGSTQ